MHIFWCTEVDISIEYIPMSESARWLGLHLFSFNGFCQVTFQGGCTNVHLARFRGEPVASHPYQHSVLSIFLISPFC